MYLSLSKTCGVWIALKVLLSGVSLIVSSSFTTLIVSLTLTPKADAPVSNADKITFSISFVVIKHLAPSWIAIWVAFSLVASMPFFTLNERVSPPFTIATTFVKPYFATILWKSALSHSLHTITISLTDKEFSKAKSV